MFSQAPTNATTMLKANEMASSVTAGVLKMRRRPLASSSAVVVLVLLTCRVTSAQVTWNIDNTTNIGGNDVTTVVGSPTSVSTPFGNGLRFDGNDGIVVGTDPVSGAANFTVEMLFRPDPIVLMSSNQPRVLHLQTSPNPPDHRATLETRVTGSSWYIDTFLQAPNAANPSVNASLTLQEPTKLHPLGQWYNYAMTYDGLNLKSYVNGVQDSTGALAVQAMAVGRTSLGMRMNQVNFFEGAIAKVRFTTSVVNPADFMLWFIPGDFDRNGTVNAADYGAWKSAFGTTVAVPGDGADGNRNGIVDAGDYSVWRDNAAAGATATLNLSIPEPATLILSAFVLLGLRPPRRWGRR